MNEVKSPKKPLLFYYILVLMFLLLFNLLAMPWMAEHRIQDVDYNTFVTMTENGEIGKVEIQQQNNRILFTKADGSTVYKTAMVPDDDLVSRLLAAGISTTGEEIEQTSVLTSILAWIVPLLVFIFIGQLLSRSMMKKMGGSNSMMFNMGKSNAKVYVKSAEGIKFDDVAGEDEAKENLTEIVNYLHDPGKYQEIGASMPKGILLVGPPGTGKTMLAKAVAGEANVPFFSMSGSEFVEMFVGMGASKVRDLFRQAKEKAPCIVFIDEIDAIGKKRDGQMGGNDEREQTLNQLLTEMDGFEGNTGVIILAATNRPESLDPALTRPGRFDRRVPVELPDLKGREEILKVHAKKIKVAEDVDFNKVARMASGASGAELANIVNEAALRAVRNGRTLCHAGGPRGEHRGRHCGLSEEERHHDRPGKAHRLLPRDRPRPRRGEADELRPRPEDYHRPPHLRRVGLYDAGRGGQPLPHEQGGAGEQDRDVHRRPRGGGGCVRLRDHRRLERH